MTLPTYYQVCPDCGGRGSISIMDSRANETEYECERCYRFGGYVPAEELLTRAEWEAEASALVMWCFRHGLAATSHDPWKCPEWQPHDECEVGPAAVYRMEDKT